MKPTMSASSVVTLTILELLAITTIINISFCNGTASLGCIETERQALLSFKQHVTDDPSNRLASWVPNGDCCTWAGIVCHNLTGHVLELHLQNPVDIYDNEKSDAFFNAMLSGAISSSLLDLKHLVLLNLSANNFGDEIPAFLGSMGSLRYLDLSYNDLKGIVPHQLGNVSHLQYLDLNFNSRLFVGNLQWVSNLSYLKHLDLSDVDLSKASDWVSSINSLPSLEWLALSSCELYYHSPSLSFLNFSGLNHLNYLDLSRNDFEGQIPEELQNSTSLRHLDLSFNSFNSTIPDKLYQLRNLESILLSYNFIKGKIPRSFGKLCHLRSLIVGTNDLSQEISEIIEILSTCASNRLETIDLENNKLFGRLTHLIGQFKRLQRLDLSGNSVSGPIPSSFGALSSLNYLDLHYNSVSGPIPSSLGELSSLNYLGLSDNSVSGPIPSSFGGLSSLNYLGLSNNSVSGPIPSSFGGLSSLNVLELSNNKLNGTLSESHFLYLTRLEDLDLSGNSLTLKVHHDWIPPFDLSSLTLSSCNIGPEFPRWLHSQKNLVNLNLSDCKISDSIPNWFWISLSRFEEVVLSNNQIYGELLNNTLGPLPHTPSRLNLLDISNNSLSGSIIHFLCSAENMSSLRFLKLRENKFSGEMPDCWTKSENLEILDLAHNKLVGKLPVSIGSLGSLRALNLHQNHLSGPIPASLQNCNELKILDISENQFAGNIPAWIGEKLSKIRIINLRSNKLDGLLPMELCRLEYLQILDLSCNNLCGRLPTCMGNFSAMVTKSLDDDSGLMVNVSVPGSESFVTKGKMYEYDTILGLLKRIDLSKNNFSGEIPIEMASLIELQGLNLSHNFLTGKIPENIGVMTQIQEIDLSCNNLSGKIPQSLSQLTFLNSLNLSNNNFVGKIPTSTQLQSLDATSFSGNDELCGPPLPDCIKTDLTSENEKEDQENEDGMLWFYVSMAFGFVVGFWGFVGPLFINRRWRYMYYGFLDYVGYKIRDVVRKCF